MKALHPVEFIALMAMTAATVAFSIDAMLPALPDIGSALSPDAPNRAQLILTSFVLGMGIGTFFTGPLSDRFGRKPVMIGGAVVYIAAALAAWLAPTLETMLAARLLQGLGAAGPRVVALAMIRDLHSGRTMARTMSFVMLVFTLVPAFAPTLGYVVIEGFGWRAVFLAFVVFSLATTGWLWLRQPETLPPAARRPIAARALATATAEVLANHTTRTSILVQTLSFAMLFATLSSIQQIIDTTYGQGARFHLWFGLVAILAAGASLINAALVNRLGMRPIIKAVFAGQVVISVTAAALVASGALGGAEFALFIVWAVAMFGQAGLTIGNLNALAMEPMGHIAGLAASAIAALSTVGAVAIAIPVGLAFQGTPLPLMLASALLAAAAYALTRTIRRPIDEPGDPQAAE